MIASIIIATRNRCAALRETLHSLERVVRPDGLEVEILVVDNGSSDDTPACLHATSALGGVRYIPEPRAGKSLALNTALGVARGDILVFLDDDVRPAAGWLSALTSPILEHRQDAQAGCVRIAPHLLRAWMAPVHLAWLASTHEINPDRPQSAVGANLAVARRVFARIPAFDTELGPGRLGLWEDTLFTAQLLQAGFRLGFEPLAVVEHHFDPARLSRAAFLAHARRQGRSSAYVAWHWRHETRGETSRYALGYRLKLHAKRMLRGRQRPTTEGIAPWEMDLTCGIAFADQWRRESRRPRAYAKFGPAKLAPPAGLPS